MNQNTTKIQHALTLNVCQYDVTRKSYSNYNHDHKTYAKSGLRNPNTTKEHIKIRKESIFTSHMLGSKFLSSGVDLNQVEEKTTRIIYLFLANTDVLK